MNNSRFSRIIIVDSIPEREFNTAKRLFDDLRNVADAYSPAPLIEYARVESGDNFLKFLSTCRDEVAAGADIPMIHIECHGDHNGFALADGSLLDWPDLKVPLTELNVATGLNLMIAVAACVGGALAKVTTMGDRAPFWGLIGPTRDMYPDELVVPYRALYSTLLKTKSPEAAVKAMDAAVTQKGTFWRTTAQALFEMGWTAYKQQHCTPQRLDERANRMLEMAKRVLNPPHPSAADFKQRLRDLEPKAFDRYVVTFFMQDLYPAHRERFPLAYQA